MTTHFQEPEEQEVHLSHYWDILLRRWKLGVAVLLIVILVTFIAHFFATPLYQSSILLQIERDIQSRSWEDMWRLPSQQEYLQTQIQLIKSRGTARRVVEDLELERNPKFYKPVDNSSTEPPSHDELLNSLGDQVAAGIRVEPVEETALVRVSYVGTDPALTQTIANGIGDSFIDANIERKSERVREATRFLRTEIEKLQQEIDAGERQVQTSGASRDIFSDDGDNLVLTRLESLNRSYLDAQSKRIAAESNYQSVRSSAAGSVAEVASDPVISGLRGDLNRLEREYEQKRASFKPAHPEMERLANQIEGARKSLSDVTQQRLAGIREEARKEYEDALTRERQIEQELEQQKSRALALNIDAVDYLAQRTNLSSKKQLLHELTQRLNETEVSARLEGADSSNIHLIETATQPGTPHNAGLRTKMKRSIPLGLVMGIGAIFFLEYMDRSVKSPEELEKLTQLPVLGVIPAARGKTEKELYGYGNHYARSGASAPVEPAAPSDEELSMDIVAHTHPRSPITESYRALRTSLLLSSAGKLQSILVTSSVPREGKSTTAANLAIVLAQMGKRVVVVDADLRKPRIRQIFGGSGRKGLVEYLANQAEETEIIESSSVPQLSFIASGPIPPNPAELLSSPRMTTLLENLRGRFDYVIVDSPPVLAVADAIIIGNQVDGLVLCAHGGRTPREVIQRASARLRQAGSHTLGSVLNNLEERHRRDRYSSHYYEYYGGGDSASG